MEQNDPIAALLNGKQPYSANDSRQSSGAGLLIALVCVGLILGLLLGTPIGYLVSAPFVEAEVADEAKYTEDYAYEAEYYPMVIAGLQSAIRFYDMPELKVDTEYQVPFNYNGENILVTVDELGLGTEKIYNSSEIVLKLSLTVKNTTSEEQYVALSSLIELVDQNGNRLMATYSGDITSADISSGDTIILADSYELDGVSEVTIRLCGSSSVPSAEATITITELAKANTMAL